MNPTHVIFSIASFKLGETPVEGKLQCKVVELPEQKQTFDNNEACNQMYEYQQALANGVDFKLDEDVERMRYAIMIESWSHRNPSQEEFKQWHPAYGKPYKLPEGLKVGFESTCCDGEHEIIPCERDCDSYKSKHGDKTKKFAFLKPKDVFDTGARLPEQKEEDQNDLWGEVYDNVLKETTIWNGIKKSRDEFILTRKS